MDKNKEQVEMLTILSEENLEDIVGGSANYKLHCWFKNSYATQQVHWKYGANRIKCYHTVCNSGCACHGKNGSDHCVEKWHWATDEGG
ncbi:MAG: hypothetical protein LBC71_02345, partial [Oscillospiraceae bacterium]|nr:hypothetical protein [Oscillospiraceae bacterium]